MQFLEKLEVLVGLFENWLPNPQDETQLEQWNDAAERLAYSYHFTDAEQERVDTLIDMYEEQHKKKIEWHRNHSSTSTVPIAYLDELLGRKQLEQRTAAWYQQMATVISASELGKLYGSPRERGKLVESKTVPYPERNQFLTAFSDNMSPFDWGIKFEPVVKQIYENKYGATIKELGRLSHQTDPRCTASPDGLIYHCPLNQRTGRLIEIKCPVSREVHETIPPQYYDQMQMQLHVTGLRMCDYVEAVFTSKYNSKNIQDITSEYSGFVALVRYAEPKGNQEFYYVYSPLNVDHNWTPEIKQDEEIVEINPWKLKQWNEQLVKRNEEWWTALQSTLSVFWEDVEKAKRGEFTIPDSSRPLKKESCMIQFHKMDECGKLLP
jgi:putative phage-type endonuclease